MPVRENRCRLSSKEYFDCEPTCRCYNKQNRKCSELPLIFVDKFRNLHRGLDAQLVRTTHQAAFTSENSASGTNMQIISARRLVPEFGFKNNFEEDMMQIITKGPSRLANWLVDWLVDWLADQLVDQLAGSQCTSTWFRVVASLKSNGFSNRNCEQNRKIFEHKFCTIKM